MCIQTLEGSSTKYGFKGLKAKRRLFAFIHPSKYNNNTNNNNNMLTSTITTTDHNNTNNFFTIGSITWQRWLTIVWVIHFVVTICVTAYGTINNHGERKYIPVDVDRVPNIKGGDYVKAFVDVFADSIDTPGALVYCDSGGGNTLQEEGVESELCIPPSIYLLFARRLAKFPEAWLLPLFPLLIRGALHVMRMIMMFLLPVGTATTSLEQQPLNNNNRTLHHHNNNSENENQEDPTVLRRVFLYLGIIQGRIWILYCVLNVIEEWIVQDPGTDCWYQSMLPTSHDTCHGRMTDFSDHIVLYFAQILPIALTEVLHSFVIPFWKTTTTASSSSRCDFVTGGVGQGKRRTENNRIIPFLLVTGLVYLYGITLLGAYKTAAFFHTGPEVFVGYLISLSVQVPLLLLQCTNIWPRLHTFFFGGPSSTATAC